MNLLKTNLLVLLGVSATALANQVDTQFHFFKPNAKSIAQQQQLVYKIQDTRNQTNQINQTQINQTAQRNLSSVSTQEEYSRWGLTQADWIKFKKLSKLERSYWSPNLDPLTLLGVEAETEAERMRYARLLAQKEFNRVAKEIAFQRAYDRAFQELYPNEKMFEVGNSPQALAQINKKEEKAQKIVLFLSLNDCASCTKAWKEVDAYRKSNQLPVEIYFVGKNTDGAIRSWAKANNLSVEEVRAKKITLNHDLKGLWFKYSKKMPSAFAINAKGEWKNLGYF